MINFNVRLPMGFLNKNRSQLLALGTILPESFQGFASAIEEAAVDAARNYADYLLGDPIPGHGALKRPAVLAGQIICRAMAGTAFAWTIGHDDDKARLIENGSPAYDMKLGLPDAKKARRSKAGALYLIIPFRHGSNDNGKGTRGMDAMPQEVYRLAKQLAFSKALKPQRFRLSATGHWVTQYRYDWGGRLPSGLTEKAKAHHKTDLYAGMVRFHDAATTTQKRSSGYITFRTMSQNSAPKSWIRPRQEGLFPLETAMQVAWDSNQESLASALEGDLLAMLV